MLRVGDVAVQDRIALDRGAHPRFTCAVRSTRPRGNRAQEGMRDATRPPFGHRSLTTTSSTPRRRRHPRRTRSSSTRSLATDRSVSPAAIGRLLGGDPADRDRVLRRQPHRARGLRHHTRRHARRTRCATRSPRRASSASRGPTCPASSTSRATSSRRSRCATTCPTCASARATGSTSPASPASRACGRCRLRPKRRACTAGATEGPGRGRDRAPLRRLERVLPPDPRTFDDVFVRGLAVGRRHARDRAGVEVRAREPQARPRAGHATARRRAAGGAAWSCTRRGTTASARSASRCRSAKPSGHAAPVRDAGLEDTRRDPGAGLPRRARRPVRRDQLDRHVRTRRCGAARRVLRVIVHAAASRRAAAQSRHLAAGLEWRARHGSRAAASSTATCSPTASCTKWAGSCRESRTRDSRRATRRDSRALRADAARVGAQPRGRVERSRDGGGRGARARLATVHGGVGDRTSKPGERRSTKCSRYATTAARAASRCVPIGAGRTADRARTASANRGRGRRTEAAPEFGRKTTSPVANDGARVRGSSGGRSFSDCDRTAPHETNVACETRIRGDDCAAAPRARAHHSQRVLPRRASFTLTGPRE